MAASGTNPAVREVDFQNSNLNDCFTQKRSFKLFEIYYFDGLLSAEAASKETSDGQFAGSAKVCRIF